MAAGGPDRRVIAGAVAIPVLIVVALLIWSRFSSSDGDDQGVSGTTSAAVTASVAVDPAWEEAVAEAFRPLTAALPAYARMVDDWSTGARRDADLAATLDEVEPVVVRVAADAAAIPPHRSEARAGALVAGAARLYVQAVAAHRTALVATDAAAAEQWDRLGRRLRILGDRTFDRARELTTGPLDAGDGVDLRLPAEVPDFDRLEMAVGPPLEPEDLRVTDALPRLRDADREAQPLADWQRDVQELDAPSAQEVRDAGADADQLARLARRLVAAAEDLREVPVPDGDRGRADRLAIGWLVLADAARARQLAVLANGPSDVAASLVELVGDAGLTEP